MKPIKLCIDPGHGMGNKKANVYDKGAVAGVINEADIALAWGLTLKWVCEREEIPFYMTRDDDRDPTPVSKRDDKAEAAGCTHMVSIHCNAGGGQGAETFYRDAKDKAFAELVLAANLNAMGTKSRGVKHESQSQHTGLAVFGFDGPNTLLEIGFIDNTAEREKMLSREVRLRFAEELVRRLKAL